jgi:small subunit ribosomal protein S16
MAVKIRLARHGKKGKPFFHIIVADSRSARNGKFIDKLGTYNPIVNPAVIELDVEAAVNWLQNGATPTDTAKAILSYKGALYMNHLKNGIKKGALTQEQADAKFEKWMNEKTGKIQIKKDKLASGVNQEEQKRMAAERAVRDAKAQSILAKQSVAEAPVEESASETASEGSEENA